MYLKNMKSEDRDFVFTQFSCDEVNRYLFDAESLTDVQGADEIIRFYMRPEPRNHHRWILTRKDDGVKMGTCGFHFWNRTEASCDIGYDLHPDFWGKGYMGEAMKAILLFARNDMKVRRINACIYVGNEKSIKLAERHGFVYKGIMKDEVFRGKKYPHKIFTLDYNAA